MTPSEVTIPTPTLLAEPSMPKAIVAFDIEGSSSCCKHQG